MKQPQTNQLIQLKLAFIENEETEKMISLSQAEKTDLVQALAELMLSVQEKKDLINIEG